MTRRIEFLDSSGHLSLDWDETDPESVARARTDFEGLRQAGYSFFRVIEQQVDTFDPASGALEVRRVEPSEVEPRLEPPPPDYNPLRDPQKVRLTGKPRGRPRKGTTLPAPTLPDPSEGLTTGKRAHGRVVAGRPMSGG